MPPSRLIREDGQLGAASDVKADRGKVGLARARSAPKGSFAVSGHDRTHAHMIPADPSGRFVLDADLGLGPDLLGEVRPDERHADRERPGSNFCSGTLVSSDGRFASTGSRLHDTVGIFSAGARGDLTYVGEEWTRGSYPRSFNFAPGGRFPYWCNQRGDNVAVFRVDHKSGDLSFTGQYVPIGNPSSFVFLGRKKGNDGEAGALLPRLNAGEQAEGLRQFPSRPCASCSCSPPAAGKKRPRFAGPRATHNPWNWRYGRSGENARGVAQLLLAGCMPGA